MADLRSLTQSIISQAFNTIDGLTEDLVYIHSDLGPFDPITEEQVEYKEEYKLKGVFDDLEEENAIKRLLRAPVTSSTMSVIIAKIDLPIKPSNSDTIYRPSTDQTFTVHKINSDPFSAEWTLWLDE